jgi:hypothetical protein
MVNIRSYFCMKALSLCNYMSSIYDHISHYIRSLYRYQIKYSNSTKWLLMQGHTLPLCEAHVSNPLEFEWKYDELTHSLTHKSDPASHQLHTFSWLSAKIVHVEENAEYDIDSFLEQLTVYTTMKHPPSLLTIFHAWCIHVKRWFPVHHMILFHTIDNMGEETTLSLKVDLTCLVVHNHKIYTELIKLK